MPHFVASGLARWRVTYVHHHHANRYITDHASPVACLKARHHDNTYCPDPDEMHAQVNFQQLLPACCAYIQ
jgi:hypothetical protein